jgi:imidazoleglycerol-phosphate dehydratase
MSKVQRETRETNITLEVKIGSGKVEASTGEPFLDHMLITLGRYAGLDLTISATGDMRHHLIEDVAITLGLALAQEVPAQAERYGWALVPMDEALAQAAVDVGGRSFYSGKIPSPLYEHFLHSFAVNLGATIHVRLLRGTDRHHMVEAAVKAVGLALRQALRTGDQVFSTKGAVALSAAAGETKGTAKRAVKSAAEAARGAAKGAAKRIAKVKASTGKGKSTSRGER